jgi:hypothetical protein
MKTMMGKIHLAVLGCLLGALSVGHAERWIDEEDQKVVEFVAASQENLMLDWPDCANAVNQVRSELGLEPIRTAEACRHRWVRYLKERNPGLKFRGKYLWMRRLWSTEESRLLVACVNQYAGRDSVDWEAVSRAMNTRGRNRTARECRAHWKIITSHWRAIALSVDPPRTATPGAAAAVQAPDAQEAFDESLVLEDEPVLDEDDWENGEDWGESSGFPFGQG